MAKDLSIVDLSAGYNDTDPPTALEDNQCTVATNIDFWRNKCGGKRNGATPITLSANVANKTEVTFLHRHFPSTDASLVQLWTLGVTMGVSLQMSYKDTAWHDVSFVDAPTNSSCFPYQFKGQSFHGKLFIAYKSGVDRLHVWDGTTLRATGLTTVTIAPTAANAGVGTLVGTRYYRVREVVVVGTTVTIRSEPSATLTFTPSGTGASITVTKPATVNPGATHWELEASLNNIDFYMVSRIAIATTTYSDTISATVGYVAFVLSEESGAYTNIPSARYIIADQDRLVVAGSFESEDQASVVRWTAVLKDPGVGNDERIPIATDNSLNLDGNDGGGITGLAGPINGILYVFKRGQIYKLIRTGQRTRAYEPVALTKTLGGLEGSIMEGFDEAGRPVIYFTDPKLGPFRIGSNGLLSAGSDINKTWRTVNLDSPDVIIRSVFYPHKNQANWWIATGASLYPNSRITLQVDATQVRQEGLRYGWTNHTGAAVAVLATCLFSENIEANTTRSLFIKPFIAVGNKVLIMDTGTTDNGTAFVGTLITKPYLVTATMNERFGIRAASLILDADATAQVSMNLIRDFGLETSAAVNFSAAPIGAENPVIGFADNLYMSNAKVIQVKITDGPANTGQWSIHRFDLVTRAEEGN